MLKLGTRSSKNEKTKKTEIRADGFRVLLSFSLMASCLCGVAASAQDLSLVEQKVHKLSDTVWWVEPVPAYGGNIAVSAGEDGILMVDDQLMPLTDDIKEAVASIQEGKIDFLINSHYHYDHAGGNAAFGEESLIIAHHSVKTRLLERREAGFNFRDEPHPAEAIPVLTFKENVTFDWNGEDIDVIYLGNTSHTDGDVVIFFRESNVIHTGDQYVNLNGYPFIDLPVGGSATGLRDNIAAMLAMIDDDTKVMPGHGPVTTKTELQAYHDRIAATIDIVEKQKLAGKSLDEIQETGLPDEYSKFTGFMTIPTWIQQVFSSLIE
jgi:glyoxylase-like metal-dependent hydrolase (beta-lactamase superfamily II)|tara:strand:- start:1004 stop:1969 length:966 start_codon:yes stop_codon:yes gene_type:complete